LFFITFEPSIRLPLSCLNWSSANEGANRILIDFEPSEETLTLVYDQDLQADFSWIVIDVNITKVVWTSNNLTRVLQDKKEVDQTKLSQYDDGLVEVSSIKVKVDFT